MDSAAGPGPRLAIVGGAILFSTGGLAIKLCGLDPWQVAAFRPAVAAVVIAAFVPAARRSLGPATWLVAVPYAATMILFTLANRATTAAHAIFLQDTAPLWVLLLGPLLLGEHVERREGWFVTAVAAGFVLLFLGAPAAFSTAPDPAGGNLLAAFSGVTWALTLIGLRWLAARPGGSGDASLAGALAGNVLAAVAAGTQAFPVIGASPLDWLLVAWLGVFQIGLAYVLISRAMTRVAALEASLLLLVEPVLAPIWAALALGERVGPVAIAGGALILGATALRAWQSRAAA